MKLAMCARLWTGRLVGTSMVMRDVAGAGSSLSCPSQEQGGAGSHPLKGTTCGTTCGRTFSTACVSAQASDAPPAPPAAPAIAP
jgi:hypothetical protein